ncbi:hypothetical protein [Ovoidimarina sediminis]|uniref:hypothetical protein n=1 Tax=Ovoidimarina sediminis TaxID=3079856 RepID=UPI00290FEB4F|nr:hypothetical protein [Rhodophyticola sp. MJ-SS7]MDU8942761.1 hypothetical protein [Rhodophyticola sp. MJ-SS7]
MPLYMFRGRHTPASLNAMVVENPQDRAAAASGAMAGGRRTKPMTVPETMSAMKRAKAARGAYVPAS